MGKVGGSSKKQCHGHACRAVGLVDVLDRLEAQQPVRYSKSSSKPSSKLSSKCILHVMWLWICSLSSKLESLQASFRRLQQRHLKFSSCTTTHQHPSPVNILIISIFILAEPLYPKPLSSPPPSSCPPTPPTPPTPHSSPTPTPILLPPLPPPPPPLPPPSPPPHQPPARTSKPWTTASMCPWG